MRSLSPTRLIGFSSLVAFVGLALGACHLESADGVTSSTSALEGSGLPCDVDAVLATSCRHCHSSPPAYGAPMPLMTHDDLVAPSHTDPSKKVYQRISERVHAASRPMPPAPNPRLSTDALATLDRWIAAGAPAATGTCGDGGAAGSGTGHLSCTPDLHVKPTSSYKMGQTDDDAYVCYGFDVRNAGARQIIGIAPSIDNQAIVHHLLLFKTSLPMGGTPQDCDPSPNDLEQQVVYAWAPGGGDLDFPADVGFPAEPNTHFMLQVHYNNVNHLRDQHDATGLDLCTTDHLRPHEADTLAFGTTKISIPPRATTDLSCDVKIPTAMQPLHVFAAFPHMHQLGTTISTEKLGAEGVSAGDLGSRTSWDFQNQYYTPVDAVLNPGDTVRTRCAWKNPGSTTVKFGVRTEDEMCFSFSLFWPRLPADKGWWWESPALLSHCQPTPAP